MVEADDPTLSVDLPNDPSAPWAAREFIRAVVQTWALDGAGEIIELLTDELVSNVVRHVSAPMQLRVYRGGSSVRVEVDDPSRDLPVLHHPDPLIDHGRGILLIEGLATAWGVKVHDNGKTVWFEVDASTAV